MYKRQTYETADVISTYVYRRAFESGDYSFSAAVGLFNSCLLYTSLGFFQEGNDAVLLCAVDSIIIQLRDLILAQNCLLYTSSPARSRF